MLEASQRFDVFFRHALVLALLLTGSGWLATAEAQHKGTRSEQPVLSTLDGSTQVFADQLPDLVRFPTPAEARGDVPTLSVDGSTSNGDYNSGDPNNTRLLLPIGAGNELIGIGWEVRVQAFSPSFLSEAIITFAPSEGDENRLLLQVATGDENEVPGDQMFSSGGTILLADAGVDDVPAGAGGTLYIEWYESFDDESVNPDAMWSDVATGQTLPPGLRLLCTDQAACDAAVGGNTLPPPTGLRIEGIGSGEISLVWVPVSTPDLVGYNVYRATAPFTSPDGAMRLTGTPEDDPDYDDTDVNPGVTYYYRVSSVGMDGSESPLSNQVTGALRAPTVTTSINLSFGDPERQQNYRLVALPGQADRTLASTVTGTSPDDWRGFREGGSSGGEAFSRAECSTATCRFTPGAGYWLLSASPWQVSEAFPTVPLTQGGTVSIPVREGWNAISNPFEIDLPWQSVRDANGLASSDEIYRWGGSWQTTGTFSSARGGNAFYFLNTDASRSSLALPFAPARPAGSTPDVAGRTSPEFELRLAARRSGEEIAIATVSALNGAADGLDDYDRYAPPGYFEAVGLALVNEALDPMYQRLRHDARPAGAEGYVFDLRIAAALGSTVELMPDMITETSMEAVLIDPVSGERHALYSGRSVSLRSASATSRYVLRVGSSAFVREGTVVPQVAELGSYPNPFAAATTIRYGLPAEGRVRLTVYDLLGKRVATLVDGEERAAGYHTAVWAPENLAGGVYIYVLETSGQRQTGKLSFIR